MEFSFTRYLLSKQSVDDRALNQHVFSTLRQQLPAQPMRVIELGAGIGTMLRRLVRWNVLQQAEYVMVDQMAENIEFACTWLPEWAAEAGMQSEAIGSRQLRLFDGSRNLLVRLEQADIFDFVRGNRAPADLLLAHAVLDLLPTPDSIARLLSLTRGLAWLTINFDGVTSLEPVIEAALDSEIERLYHASMDRRATGGDSRSGRHLFARVADAGAEILAAGSSDWVVHAIGGRYEQDEAYFLNCILHFFKESLTGNAELDAGKFAAWLEERGGQIERGELVYIAHQMDLLVRR